LSENFSVSVAEALTAGLPVITTTCTPWQEIQNGKYGWWIEPTIDALAQALTEAMRLTDEKRREMGKQGADWARSRFNWPSVAQDTRLLYRWIIEGGKAPGYVLFQS
jgi:glycosyltransferase involved in cell wall biosynthesis